MLGVFFGLNWKIAGLPAFNDHPPAPSLRMEGVTMCGVSLGFDFKGAKRDTLEKCARLQWKSFFLDLSGWCVSGKKIGAKSGRNVKDEMGCCRPKNNLKIW